MTGSKLHIPNRILCNAADLDDLSEEKAPAQIHQGHRGTIDAFIEGCHAVKENILDHWCNS